MQRRTHLLAQAKTVVITSSILFGQCGSTGGSHVCSLVCIVHSKGGSYIRTYQFEARWYGIQVSATCLEASWEPSHDELWACSFYWLSALATVVGLLILQAIDCQDSGLASRGVANSTGYRFWRVMELFVRSKGY